MKKRKWESFAILRPSDPKNHSDKWWLNDGGLSEFQGEVWRMYYIYVQPFYPLFSFAQIAFFSPITPLHTTIRSPSSRWPPRCFARLDARVMYYYVAWRAIGDIQRRRIARWLQYVLFTVWTSAVFFYIKIGFFLVARHIYTHVPPCVRAFTLYIARHSACFDTHLDHWQRHLDRKCLRTHTRQLTDAPFSFHSVRT